MSKLKPDQVNELAELRESGWSFARLAARYGVSTGAIHYRCLTVGALSPKSRPIVAGAARKNAARGFGGRVKHFTLDEDAQLLAMARTGAKIETIAAALNRARTSVRIRLLTLELKADLA